ncbi:MAG: YigZ family protein [Psychrosphaera sp.]|nr:YigZ family protein [Psychrosphaera sp.]
MSYSTPKHFHQFELEIKKSRFIAWADEVTDRQQAMAFLQKAKDAYPDARHHCWAYKVGNPKSPTNAAMSDDGEPSGTAGKPILNVLQHKDVGDVMVIVIRYFGGIKLGAGGLVRAYSGATEKVMSELPIQTHITEIEKTIHVAFAKEQLMRHWLSQNSGRVVEVNYGYDVEMTVAVEESCSGLLAPFLAGI